MKDMTFARVVARINLYDIMAMIVPGGVYLLCIITLSRHYLNIDVQQWEWLQTLIASKGKVTVEVSMWFLILVSSYVIGMAHQTFHAVKTMVYRHFNIDSRHWLLKHTIEKKFAKYKAGIPLDDNNYDYYDIRATAQEDDTHGTIVTIEYQYAMLRSLRFPITLLVALSCTCLCCAILLGVVVYVSLSVLMLARQNYLMTILMRHYRIQLTREERNKVKYQKE